MSDSARLFAALALALLTARPAVAEPNVASDLNHCGALGNRCLFYNGFGTCKDSTCTYLACHAAYELTANACVHLPPTDLSNDVNNCGAKGHVCEDIAGANATVCVAGQCQAAGCEPAYTLIENACIAVVEAPIELDTLKIDTTWDVDNCGSVGNKCDFGLVGLGSCIDSACKLSACQDGYVMTPEGNSCGKSRKHKKVTSKVDTLCPSGESACPILGSASLISARQSNFAQIKMDSEKMLAGGGGYECLDTQYSIESCGGCASIGEGRNCLNINHAVGVGCNTGSCVVFSCKAGYKPNRTSTHCVRAAVGHHQHRRSGSNRHVHHQFAS